MICDNCVNVWKDALYCGRNMLLVLQGKREKNEGTLLMFVIFYVIH